MRTQINLIATVVFNFSGGPPIGGKPMQYEFDTTDSLEIETPEELRPRIARKLGLSLPWDQAVDELSTPDLRKISGWCALLCRSYRTIRPRSIGNRCAFEPSCSRYSEISFRAFGFRKGITLTINRLRHCSAKNGGLDLPPKILCGCPTKLEETLNEIQN